MAAILAEARLGVRDGFGGFVSLGGVLRDLRAGEGLSLGFCVRAGDLDLPRLRDRDLDRERLFLPGDFEPDLTRP